MARLLARGALLALAVAAAGLVISREARAAAWVEIVNLDGPGEGLNDPAPVTPAGGNPGTTLGEARRRAVEAAVAIWAESLSSPVPIRLGVRFDSLGGTSAEATLGLGGAEDLFRDFAGAPRAGTWYPAALADRLAGLDLAPGALDLTVTFNRDVDGDLVLGSTRFYYGFDGQPPAGDVELLEVAVHELAHGLGWATYLDRVTGAKLLGYDDAYLVYLERHGAAPADFPSMSDAQRQAAATAGAEVHWVGPQAVAAAANRVSGIGAGGHPELYAPPALDPASSLTHLAPSLAPDELMEPFYVGALELDRGLGLTVPLLRDVGWGSEPGCEAWPPPGPGLIFEDGFESGDLSAWSETVGEGRP